MAYDRIIQDGILKQFLERMDACKREIEMGTVLEVVDKTSLPIGDAEKLRAQLSFFVSAREYEYRFKERPAYKQSEIAFSIKAHAEKLAELLSGYPRFGMQMPNTETVCERLRLVADLRSLSISAENVLENIALGKELGDIAPASSKSVMKLIGYNLAIIFESCFGRKAGGSGNAYSETQGGPFARFARAVHQLVYPLSKRSELPLGTINKALLEYRSEVEGWRKATGRSLESDIYAENFPEE